MHCGMLQGRHEEHRSKRRVRIEFVGVQNLDVRRRGGLRNPRLQARGDAVRNRLRRRRQLRSSGNGKVQQRPVCI